MNRYTSLTAQQNYYRYDPLGIEQKGAARLFPYAGEDGTLRYIVWKLYQNLLVQGRLSTPWILLLSQVGKTVEGLTNNLQILSIILADCEVLQSGWFNFDLPPNEQLNSSYVQEIKKLGLRLLAATQATKCVHKNLGEGQQQREQRQRFFQSIEQSAKPDKYYVPQRPLAKIIHERDKGLSDRFFVYQRLAGANPLVLRRVRAIDKEFLQAVVNQSYQLTNGDTVDLVKAVSENRLFIADYPLFRDLKPTDLQLGKYVGSPRGLFYRNEQELEPILIELEKGRIVTPASTGGAADDWMRAKLYFQIADANHHALISHLCYTHLAMEALAIATPRQLPSNHPVYKLLTPHFQFLLAINQQYNKLFLTPEIGFNQLLAPTLTASNRIINRAYREKSFWYYSLLNDIEIRGVEAKVLPDFPYRDDALLLWEAIAKYTTRYLQRYYPDDKTVIQDPYLQTWAEELGAPLNTRPQSDFPTAPNFVPQEWLIESGIKPQELPTHPRIPGFTKIGSLQQLIDIATIVIFTCAPQHAAINYSQFDYLSYVPNSPFSATIKPDTPGKLAEILPPFSQELQQMQLTFALSGIYWGNLGSSDLIQFTDKNDKEILTLFQKDLLEIERQIKQRNQQRLRNYGVEYPYLLPSRIPNSINI
ncbi:MAG TPA: lipoxygenase family protein [Nostocaceae cyanobacterium]|nr:lipoxygenase family protein [Nostocaceae cyanobacterium]